MRRSAWLRKLDIENNPGDFLETLESPSAGLRTRAAAEARVAGGGGGGGGTSAAQKSHALHLQYCAAARGAGA